MTDLETSVAEYWASRVRELIKEAHAAGAEIYAHVICDEYEHEVSLKIVACGLVENVDLDD